MQWQVQPAERERAMNYLNLVPEFSLLGLLRGGRLGLIETLVVALPGAMAQHPDIADTAARRHQPPAATSSRQQDLRAYL